MSHPFDQLTPDLVLDAVESLGYLSDARVLALNSYENRVYQVGIEDGEPLIAKFYRPDRWSDAAIREEHAFSAELAECEVPVVAPLSRDGESLFAFSGFRFALFPPARRARARAGQSRPALPPRPVARPPARGRRHAAVRAPRGARCG